MSCESCKSGFAWSGTPVGKETTFNGRAAYVTGESKAAAVLFLTDVFGYKLINAQLLADHYAKEANVSVYVPDLFGGEVIAPDILSDPSKRAAFDLPSFLTRNSKEIRGPEIRSAAAALKLQYRKVAAIGFCYGGWGAFELAASSSSIDAISVAHPSRVTREDIAAVKVPLQFLSGGDDHAFPEEMRKFTLEELPKTGVPWEYVYFPGVGHGFAARGDPGNKVQREAFERAMRCAVGFFKEYLH